MFYWDILELKERGLTENEAKKYIKKIPYYHLDILKDIIESENLKNERLKEFLNDIIKGNFESIEYTNKYDLNYKMLKLFIEKSTFLKYYNITDLMEFLINYLSEDTIDNIINDFLKHVKDYYEGSKYIIITYERE